MDLQGFNKFCTKISGGYQSLEYAPATWFTDAAYFENIDTGTWVSAPVLTAGKSWLSLPYVALADRPFNGAAKQTKFGSLYDTSVAATLPSLTVDVSAELSKMQTLRWFVLRFSDKNGEIWFGGTPENPLEFDYTISGGKNASTANNIIVTFKGKLQKSFIGL